MTPAVERPPLAPDVRTRIIALLDEGAAQAGLQTYSEVKADLALAHVGFNAAVRERVIGLVSAENRRMRVALTATRGDARMIAALLAQGEPVKAASLAASSAQAMEKYAHVMRRHPLPADVPDLVVERERREGGR